MGVKDSGEDLVDSCSGNDRSQILVIVPSECTSQSSEMNCQVRYLTDWFVMLPQNRGKLLSSGVPVDHTTCK